MLMIEFFKIECFYLPWIQKEHRYIYSCSQTPPRENWFEYERREYATAINFPCLITLPPEIRELQKSIIS